MSIFVRESTGLVREVGPLKALLVSMGYNGFLIVPFVYLTGMYLYGEGNSAYIALIASWLMFIPGVIMWYLITRQYPRTGGDYVYFSRLNPPVGFAAWFNFTIGEMLYDAVLVYFSISQLGIVLQALGNPLAGIITSPRYEFAIAVALVVVLIMVNVASARAGLTMFMIISAAALLTFIASAVYIALLPISLIKSSLGSAYVEALMNASKASPTGGVYGVLGMASFTTAVWAYVNFPATIGGEIRRDRVTALLGVIGMFIIGGLFFTLFVASFLRSLGVNFYIGASYMYAYGVDNGFILINPGADLALIHTPIAIALAYSSFLWYIAPVTGVIIQVSRYLLAFSMDRVLPGVFSYVNPRTHSPVVAHLFDLAVTVILMYILILTPFSSSLLYALNLDALILLVFTFITSVLLALIMYVKGIVKLQVSKVLITSLTAVYLAFLLIFAYYWLTQPQYYLYVTGNPIQLLAESSVIFVIGLIIFAVVKHIRDKEGIPLSLVYEEIPPE
ncbi:APC family permease [Caldivirga sp. UBA161]|uniref:APC family permease n=1 Tax=Caldivirga sp. UBA161 TaxID=1915569 RepID=UPI0025BCFBC3|nr:amino acid permease [Caldivirga sp. UBA161]